jgi:hypothetical protein
MKKKRTDSNLFKKSSPIPPLILPTKSVTLLCTGIGGAPIIPGPIGPPIPIGPPMPMPIGGPEKPGPHCPWACCAASAPRGGPWPKDPGGRMPRPARLLGNMVGWRVGVGYEL